MLNPADQWSLILVGKYEEKREMGKPEGRAGTSDGQERQLERVRELKKWCVVDSKTI